MLANALEETLQHESEKKRLDEYRAVIPKLEEQERHLAEVNAKIRELSFAKRKKDTAQLKALRDEKIMPTNRGKAKGKEALDAYKTAVIAKQAGEIRERRIIEKEFIRLAKDYRSRGRGCRGTAA